MRHPTHRPLVFLALTINSLVNQQAFAYPEFQKYVQQNSGRNVNCAMCHAHPDGPEGLKAGQIGSLSPQEIDLLSRARAAFEPGQKVQNPLLNAFGNDIVKRLGKSQFLLLRQDPKKLAESLGRDSDLDGDSICDADEYLAGTLPLDPNHGDPVRLFIANLRRSFLQIVMVGLATVLGVYGLHEIVRGFETSYRAKKDSGETSDT